MKKLITMIFAIFAIAFTASAQWKTTYHEADELRGQDEYYASVYTDENGNAFICWNNETNIKIVSRNGIFDYDDNYVSVIIGFYENNTLKEKISTYFWVPDGDADTAYTPTLGGGWRRIPSELGKKIATHIKNTGKVRIIASRYSGPDFDMIIPKNPSLKYDL